MLWDAQPGMTVFPTGFPVITGRHKPDQMARLGSREGFIKVAVMVSS